jgi:hypothetical protein
MTRFVLAALLILAGALASACNFFAQPVDLQTENLQNQQAQTQIAAVRATATVNADRMMITLENAQTAVGNIDLQSTRIASTLIAQGMTFVDANIITQDAPIQAAPPTDAIPQIANPLLTQSAPVVSGSGSASGDTSLIPITPTTPPVQQDQQAQSTPVDTSGAYLSSIVMTNRVGSNDCPVGNVTDIYVTAIANNVPANSTLEADFSLGGQMIQSYSWTPDFDIRGACIWFHMPSSDVEFTPGNWSVTLTINGAPAGSANFSIAGDVPSEINLTPGTNS